MTKHLDVLRASGLVRAPARGSRAAPRARRATPPRRRRLAPTVCRGLGRAHRRAPPPPRGGRPMTNATAPASIEREAEFAAEPARVWQALTDPAELELVVRRRVVRPSAGGDRLDGVDRARPLRHPDRGCRARAPIRLARSPRPRHVARGRADDDRGVHARPAGRRRHVPHDPRGRVRPRGRPARQRPRLARHRVRPLRAPRHGTMGAGDPADLVVPFEPGPRLAGLSATRTSSSPGGVAPSGRRSAEGYEGWFAWPTKAASRCASTASSRRRTSPGGGRSSPGVPFEDSGEVLRTEWAILTPRRRRHGRPPLRDGLPRPEEPRRQPPGLGQRRRAGPPAPPRRRGGRHQ